MNEVNIYDLLPQRTPFVMVDKLVHFDPIITRTELLIREDNLFVNSGIMNEFGVIENIAQTCAARIGYMASLSDKPIKIGMIGGIKNFSLQSLPHVGEKIETAINVIGEVMSLTLVSAQVMCAGREIANCEMKIALKDE